MSGSDATSAYFNPLPPHGGRPNQSYLKTSKSKFQSTPSAWRETVRNDLDGVEWKYFNPLPPHGGRPKKGGTVIGWIDISIHSLRMEGDFDSCRVYQVGMIFQSTPSAWRETNQCDLHLVYFPFQSTPSAWRETDDAILIDVDDFISIHSLRMEGDSKTAQESVFHFAYPCTILQKRMQKTTFCTRKNGFFRKKGEKFGAKPSASFCAPMIRTDTFPLNFSHRISGSSMSMVSFAPICSTFD